MSYGSFMALIQKKGIGQHMGKCLMPEDFPDFFKGFQDPDIPLSSKATLLTALLFLDPTPDEALLIQRIQSDAGALIPLPLHVLLFTPKAPNFFISCIHRILNRETLSYEEMQLCWDFIFNSDTPDFLKASFLEAERLKRESLDENLAALDYLWNRTQRLQTDLPVIVDLSTSYDGLTRTPFLLPFVAMTLGKQGIPTLLHGIDDIGPKHGVNFHKVLQEMGYPIPTSLEEAFFHLKDPQKGWTYVDQALFHPELYALKQLRLDMLKRPMIATLEKFLQPIRAQNGNFIVTGYTHPAYKEMTANLLLRQHKVNQFLCFRGAEGAAQLPIDRRTPFVSSVSMPHLEGFLSPESFGFSKHEGLISSEDASIEASIRLGKAALEGIPGPYTDLLNYTVRTILLFLGLKHPASG